MRSLPAAGLLLAAGCILGLLGPLDDAPRAAGIAVGLAFWGRAAAREIAPSLRVWVSIVAGAPAVLAAGNPETALALLACAGMAMGYGRVARAGALFAAGALAHRLLLAGAPWVRGVEVEVSRLLSSGVGAATGQRIDLGPTASGLDLFVLFLLLASQVGDGVARFARRSAAAAAMVCLFVAVLPWLGRCPTPIPFDELGLFNRANDHLVPAPQQVARSMFGWSIVLLGALAPLCAWGRGPGAPSDTRASSRRRAGALTLSALLLILLWAGSTRSGPRRSGEVLLLKSPAFDLETPTPGRFGAGQAGMLGLLPRYLALDGHRMRVHDGPVTHEALSGAAVVVSVLPTAPYAAAERVALEAFVSEGGSLLVAGDHTDLLGTMAPINDLTAPRGVEIAFDSAYPAAREWSRCIEGRWPGWPESTGIGTGASLRVSGMARPILYGRYALADSGDRANSGQGAQLGNYAYDAGEQLGDLVVAAEARLGRGRIVVLGDTSSIQNIVLPASYSFVAGLFDDLAREEGGLREAARHASAAAGAALGAMALAGSPVAAGGLAAAALTMSLTARLDAAAAPLDRLRDDARVALIDDSHLNAYARELWRPESIAGLIVNLQRNGYLPLRIRDGYGVRPIPRAALPVVVAPRRSLTRRETRALVGHMRRGGDVLASVGPDEATALSALLSMHGLSVRRLPLGPVPIQPDTDRAGWEAMQTQPQFRRAWPVVAAGPSIVESLYRAFGFDVVVEARSDGCSGRLLVVADPDFLTDRVLEDEHGAWPGNVDLLRRILAAKSARDDP